MDRLVASGELAKCCACAVCLTAVWVSRVPGSPAIFPSRVSFVIVCGVCVCVAVFVRSEYSDALVGDGVLQPAPRSANLDSAFGGMQLFAPEAWRAAPLPLTHSAQFTQPTVRLPQLCPVTAMGSPSLALSHLCCGLCERHCSATAGTL